MGLDFYEKKTNIMRDLEAVVEFSEVGHVGQSLEVEDVDIANLEELKSMLQNTKLNIMVYTKNRKTLEHFCEYNDCNLPTIQDIGNI